MSSVYKNTIYLILALLIFFSFTHFAHATSASQLDYSVYGGVGYVNGYLQTLGHISGNNISTTTLRIHSTAVSPYNTAQIRILECTNPLCTLASVTKIWIAYTSSSRTTESSYIFTLGSYEGFINIDFTFAKDQLSDATSNGVPLDINKYYAIWFWGNDGNVTRFAGSAMDQYSFGSCYMVNTFASTYPLTTTANSCTTYSGYGIYDAYFTLNNGSGVYSDETPPVDDRSQIISFTPENRVTTSSTTVEFTYKVYVNEEDIGFWSGKQMTFDFQRQPIGIGTYLLDKVHATTSGYYTFSTTRVLSPGNYILNACLETYYIGGIVGGFDFIGNSCQYHQFVVGTSTFVGNLFQNGVTAIDEQLGTLTSTSSTATLGAYCNPFSGFDIIQCFYALLIPTSSQLKDTMDKFYSDFLTRVPWGYGTVAVADLLGYGKVATTSLSSSNLTITLPDTGVFATATSTAMMKGKTLTFIDWSQMASSTVKAYWAPALTPINNFINIMMGASFIFWLFHFFKKLRP